MKRLLIVLLVIFLVSIGAIINQTTTVGRADTKLVKLPATTVTQDDTLRWVLRYIHSPKLLAHFYANGDSTGITLNVEGTNFDVDDDVWIQMANYTFSGALNDTSYITTDAYWTHRFTITTGDTTSIQGAVKITY